MSTDLAAGAPPAGGAGRPAARRRPDLRLSARGLGTVVRLELRQRVRSTRWLVALAVWVAVIALVTVLVGLAFASEDLLGPDPVGQGPLVFSLIVFLVLSMGLLVSPALAATAVNGDRAAGTLAPLQVTLLSPLEIALGKLVAAWVASLVLLLAAAPFLVWAYAQGDVALGAVLSTLVLTALVLAVVCAIGLGWSAVCARPAASAVLTYVSVASLCFLSPLVFALTAPLVLTDEQVTVREQDFTGVTQEFDDRGNLIGEEPPCVEAVRTQPVFHGERTWWLLALSPYVVVADAAPRPPVDPRTGLTTFDPLSGIREGVRAARLGPQPEDYDSCTRSEAEFAAQEAARRERLDGARAVWPWGLGANLALGALGVAAAARRLQVPYGELARGTRVA